MESSPRPETDLLTLMSASETVLMMNAAVLQEFQWRRRRVASPAEDFSGRHVKDSAVL